MDAVHVTGVARAEAGIDALCATTATSIPESCPRTTAADPERERRFDFTSVDIPGLEPGPNRVTVFVRDRRGQVRSAAVEFTVATPESGIDLQANGLEVTQGTQLPGPISAEDESARRLPYAGVEVVARKQTVVRLFANARSTAAAGVDVRGARAALWAFRPGSDTPLPGSPIFPNHGPTTLARGDAVVDSERLDARASFNFVLPRTWTSGEVDLRGEINPASVRPTIAECEGCEANNRFELSGVRFLQVPPLTVNPVNLTHTQNGRTVNPPSAESAFRVARLFLPVAEHDFHVLPTRLTIDVDDYLTRNNPALGPPDTQAQTTYRNGLMLNRIVQDIGSDRLDPSVYGHPFGLIAHNVGGAATKLRFARSGLRPVGLADTGRLGKPVTHELGHMLGLGHASAACGATLSRVDDWPEDQMGFLQGVGLDLRGGSRPADPYPVRAPGVAGGPAQLYDFMSYCGGDDAMWVSPRNWGYLLEVFTTPPPRSGRVAAAQAGAVLMIDGLVLEDGSAVVGAVRPGRGSPTPGAEGAAQRLVVRDAAGVVLSDAGLPLEGLEDSTLQTFFAVVPAAGAARIEVVRDGAVLAERSRSATVPAVRIRSPRAGAVVGRSRTTRVEWTATDPDGEPLTATVDYSADGGRTYAPVAVGRGGGPISVPSASLSASRNARIRVRVSDGFNEGVAVSARFSAVGAPPVVRIGAPGGSAALPADGTLPVAGEAYDDRGRRIPSKRLRWLDGRRVVARGETATVTGLTPGKRRLRLEATDSAGRIGSSSVTVRVGRADPAFTVLSSPERLGRSKSKLKLRVASSFPARLSIGKRRFDVDRTARSLTVPVRPGSTALTLRLRLTGGGRTTSVTLSVVRG
jgi:hypothetical protein